MEGGGRTCDLSQAKEIQLDEILGLLMEQMGKGRAFLGAEEPQRKREQREESQAA